MNGPSGICDAHFQAARPGSYAQIDAWAREPLLSQVEDINLSFYAQPWMLDSEFPQALVSWLDVDAKAGLSVMLDHDNDLLIWIGTDQSVEAIKVSINARRERWFHVSLRVHGKDVVVTVEHVPFELEPIPASTQENCKLENPAKLLSHVPLLFAASRAVTTSVSSTHPTHFYNGRLDAPKFTALGDRSWILAQYDFSIGIDTEEITDISGSGLHGRLINAPTRSIRGHDWDHRLLSSNWKTAKYGFGAIHFHDDDLDDANWEANFSFTVPSGLRSGAYAIEAWCPETGLQDDIVFFVRPTTVRPQAKTAFVFSTFTYLAYANEHMFDETKSTHISFPEGVQLLASENYEKMVRRHDLGLAIYDLHSDGSGVVYSTTKRPILNMRPDYVHWGFQRPREFSADLLMVGYLESRLGDAYDVLTDHDLHLRGASALANYDVVITGSHPEYPSAESLDAYTNFVKRGGSLMYTGGNGFYVSVNPNDTRNVILTEKQWKSVTDPKRPHRMEVRRADVGARTHENPAGERYHALNGELGGLWRSLGRPPNVLFGIGSCASGKGPGRPFIPTAETLNNPDLSWVWKGLKDPSRSLLGVHGLAGGASGDELDRLDFGIGTPSNAILLARSQRHDDHFMLFNEELIFPMIGTLGSSSELVRSDMVYFQAGSGGGSIFSVGSINWNNSLCWDDYENDIATVTDNVLFEFLGRRGRERKGKTTEINGHA